MAIFTYEVDSVDELKSIRSKLTQTHRYKTFLTTDSSVLMRRKTNGVWLLTAVAALATLVVFFARANVLQWQPIIGAATIGGSTLIVWALAIVASILQTPMVEIKIVGDYGFEEEE